MKFDVVVLTAANEAQADGYRAQLAWRKENGLFDKETETLVVADLGNRRIGSFCATLNVLSFVRRKFGFAAGTRILICHSGGDSRRTPAYAAQGKVFTPVPCKGAGGQPLALFDLILQNASKLPLSGGALVASGDVVLTFGDDDLSQMDFSHPGATGIGYYDTLSQGSHHGVYVPGSRSGAADGKLFGVADFLQKPDETTARKAGAVTDGGLVAVDTGLVAIDAATCRTLADLADGGLLGEIADGRCPQMDFYEEFMMALVPSVTEEAYLRRFSMRPGCDAAHAERLRGIYRALHNIGFSVNVAKECDFFHLGSSAELLGGFTGDSLTAKTFGFASAMGGGSPAYVFNSQLGKLGAQGSALVEGVAFGGALHLAGDNIVTGFPAGMGAGCTGVSLPAGVGLVAMPVGEDSWAVVAYGVRDDFKTAFGGAKPCLFLNKPVEEWLAAHCIVPGALWKGDESAGMWTARLWRVGTLPDVVAEAVDFAGGVADGLPKPRRPFSPDDGSPRYCMAELVKKTNHARLCALCAP